MSAKKSVYRLVLLLSLIVPVSGTYADQGATIKKCKDATGMWHYGDTAAEECSHSKVTVMTEEGTTKKVIAAPPTEQELKQLEQRQEAEEAEHKKAEDQAKKDVLLLSTYGSEDDINYIRDRKVAQVETTIKSSEETLKSLRAALARMEALAVDETKGGKASEDKTTAKNIELTKAQIARHEALIADKHKEQETLRKQYADELERYRELKKQQPAKAASAPVKKQ